VRFRYLGDPLFLACCACYGANRWAFKRIFESGFFRYWFNDLLLVPCAIPVVLWLFRLLRLRKDDEPPSLLELSWILAVWALLFEWLGPMFVRRATADWLDVAMYCIGGFGAWLYWANHSPGETPKKIS
jgi:hypothetical protein